MKWPSTMPPLNYISEKMGNSLLALHSLYQNIVQFVPDDLSHPSLVRSGFLIKQDALLTETFAAFRYELIAYLALLDLTSIANDQGMFKRLLDLSAESFQGWLREIEEGTDSK